MVFGGGGREWAVDLHLHHGVNCVEVRPTRSGSCSLAHHQKFIKSEVWAELCAGFPGVAKKLGMQPTDDLSHSPFGDVLPANG